MTMQTRRTTGLTPLAIVLPHPPLPRRTRSKSSLLSSGDPHTPRSCHSPSLSNLHAVYYQSSNRKSSDSWNSSNADDMEFEWLPDQVLFLSRTLDALPAHLITPFHGPIPPSNLLDKIARSVTQAKGPTDWPHSIRATRMKLLELSRMKAKDEMEKARERNRHLVIREENEMDDVHTGVDGIEGPRPLYRQSSMDFIKPGPEDIKENTAIARLSKRLQRTDRLLAYQYHPYSRPKGSPADSHVPGARSTGYNLKHRRSASPPHQNDVPSLISPSTPSSSTLNSLSSASASAVPRGLRLRRSTSTMSSLSMCDSADGALVDPRVQRLKRSQSHCVEPISPLPASAPIPPPKDGYILRSALKRAPSYGAVKQEAKLERQRKKEAGVSASVVTDTKHLRHERKLSTESVLSSDEEEKTRSKGVKRLKTTPLRSSSSSVPSSPVSDSSSSNAMGNSDTAPSSPFDNNPSKKTLPTVLGLRTKTPKSMTSNITGAVESRRITRSNLNPNSKVDEVDMKDATKASKTTKALSSPTNVRSKAAPNRPSGRPLPMNLQRNPSMFGEELPQLPVVDNLSGTAATTLGAGERIGKNRSGEISSKERIGSSSPVSPLVSKTSLKSPTLSPSSPGTRTLRRVRRLDLGLGFGLGARKIEFGTPGGEAGHETKKPGSGNVLQGLESAIQLV